MTSPFLGTCQSLLRIRTAFRSMSNPELTLGSSPQTYLKTISPLLGWAAKGGYIRRLMVVGMTSRIKQIKNAPERFDPWLADILQLKPAKLAAIAMTNKTARIIWAVLSRNENSSKFV